MGAVKMSWAAARNLLSKQLNLLQLITVGRGEGAAVLGS